MNRKVNNMIENNQAIVYDNAENIVAGCLIDYRNHYIDDIICELKEQYKTYEEESQKLLNNAENIKKYYLDNIKLISETTRNKNESQILKQAYDDVKQFIEIDSSRSKRLLDK